jgi:ornithine cyclodeaminase
MSRVPSFAVISGAQVHRAISGREVQVTEMIEAAYRLHGQGATVNPDSYFLRLPDQPSSRIIALPASVKGDVLVHGMKWVSSFPENADTGLPRASAVVILNDPESGYPFACLEGSIISAARTAASAALAARTLSEKRRVRPASIGFIGVGLIARYIHSYLSGNGFKFDKLGVYDLSIASTEGFTEYLAKTDGSQIVKHGTAESLIRSSDLIVLATIAAEPHIHDPRWFAHNPLVLHISLRDLSPEIILSSCNVVDDIQHCLKANTSPHLAEQQVRNRDFISGTLYDVLSDVVVPPADMPVVFSPFGLGVLDLTVAKYVYDRVTADGDLLTIPGFFHELKRYG